MSKLEQISFEQANESNLSLGWVSLAVLQVKVPFAVVFQIYHDLFEARLPPWSSPKAIAFLIQNAVTVIERWFEHIRSPSVGIYERFFPLISDDFPARLIDEALSKYLVSVPVSSKPLISKLQAIQSRVRSTF